tara:strand:+ start:860 stop:1069 length:210 start_codon:yes stop_codon:yes gene_type:complete
MSNNQETPGQETSIRLKVLIDRHRQLDIEADKLSTCRYLSPTERIRLRELKVRRLKAKDAIRRMKEELK